MSALKKPAKSRNDSSKSQESMSSGPRPGSSRGKKRDRTPSRGSTVTQGRRKSSSKMAGAGGGRQRGSCEDVCTVSKSLLHGAPSSSLPAEDVFVGSVSATAVMTPEGHDSVKSHVSKSSDFQIASTHEKDRDKILSSSVLETAENAGCRENSSRMSDEEGRRVRRSRDDVSEISKSSLHVAPLSSPPDDDVRADVSAIHETPTKGPEESPRSHDSKPSTLRVTASHVKNRMRTPSHSLATTKDAGRRKSFRRMTDVRGERGRRSRDGTLTVSKASPHDATSWLVPLDDASTVSNSLPHGAKSSLVPADDGSTVSKLLQHGSPSPSMPADDFSSVTQHTTSPETPPPLLPHEPQPQTSDRGGKSGEGTPSRSCAIPEEAGANAGVVDGRDDDGVCALTGHTPGHGASSCPTLPATDTTTILPSAPQVYGPERATLPLSNEATRVRAKASGRRGSAWYRIDTCLILRTGTKQEDVRWDRAKKFVAVMGARFVASCILTLGAWSILGRTRGAIPRLCLTDDCSAHISLLSVFLNSSVDPCQDFDALVCPQSGASFTEAPAVGVTRSTLSLMRWRWLNGLRKLLKRGQERLVVGARKALFMYTSCITQEKEASTRDAVTLFMDKLNLRRPTEPTPRGHAFGVLLDLAFNWNAPLWFQVSLLPRDAYYPRQRLLISSNPLMAEWQETLVGLRSVRDYRERWSEVKGLLRNDSEIAQSNARTVNIFRTFLNHSVDGAPWQFFLEDVSKHITFSEDMAPLLNEHLQPKQKFSELDVMVFEETGLLKAVNVCFALYDDSELLDHIHWLFAETYGSIADPSRLSVCLHGDDSQRGKRRLYYCAAVVEASYQLLVNALFAVSRFTPPERNFLADLLSKVYEEMVSLLRHADWFNWRTKSKALAKFEHIRTVLWPREDLLNDAGIAGVYDNFPDYASSFGAFWVDTRRAMRNFQAEHGSAAGFELTSAPTSYVLPLVKYTHVLNTAFVSMGALERPLYYSSGTRAMLYGGLGYQYAQQIIRVLDSFGVTVDEHGDRVESWLSATSADGFDKRVRCLGSADGDIFPEVPALEVAYATYVRAAEEVKGERSLYENVSEAQIFFITMCVAMCRLPKARNCNKAVMAFRSFADAFGCKPGTKMNRPQKCSFFE